MQQLVTYMLILSGGVGAICFARITSTPLRSLVLYILLAIIIDQILIHGAFENRGMWVKILYTLKRPLEYAVFISLFYGESTFVYKKQFYVLTITILLAFGLYNLEIGRAHV